jgi:septum formation protein
MKVILASSSPRRLALLQMLGIQPVVSPPEIEEGNIRQEPIPLYLERITREKGNHVKASIHDETLIISSDTVVHVAGRILGKPSDRNEAVAFLQSLSGRWHEVISGIYLRFANQRRFSLEETRVFFSPLTEADIHFYLDHENYSDKAGAYGIQSMASLFVERIEGCYFNVVGLPINLFYRMIKEMGLTIQSLRSRTL